MLKNREDFKYEQSVLDNTIKNIEDRTYYISETVENKKGQFKVGINSFGDGETLRSGEKELSLLDSARQSPYFGRIDIHTKEEGQETYYIGKQGVKNRNEEIVVLDWRMPLATVYYNFTPGQPEQSYEVEVDKKRNFKENITANVSQKREFTIKDQKLIKIIQQVASVDSDLNKTYTNKGEQLTVTDDFLREIIENSETTGYLKEIIATIQREQNVAIRQPISKNLIVQGVAGSGKSSIALHRLSFLLFNNNKLKPEDVLILGPSNLFISSFKDMLPDLDLDGINQSTFKDFALQYLQGYVGTNIMGSYYDFFENVLFKDNKHNEHKRIEFKGSDTLALLIDIFVDEYKINYQEKIQSFSLWGERFDSEQLRSIFEGYAYLPFAIQVNKFLEHVNNHYLDLMNRKVNDIKSQYDSIVSGFMYQGGLSTKSYEEIKSKMKGVYQYKKRALDIEFKKEIEKFKQKYRIPGLITLYKRILSPEILSSYQNEISSEIVDAFKGYSNKNFSYFDLPPLLYLFFSFYGEPKKLAHIVIDEAQDFSYMHFAVLKKVTNTMTVLGDKDQSIFLNYGQQSWENIRNDFFNSKADQLLTMDTSYRSTKEIIDAANAVLSNQIPNRKPITPINRSGPAIKFEEVQNGNELMKNITSSIEDWAAKYKRIAIIHKDEQKAEKLAIYLKQELNKEVVYIRPEQDITNSHISVLASYNSKGMEFDGVMLVNVNEESFPADDFHARLLYVLLTRAQKEVKVFYQDKPSELLNGLVQETPQVVSKFDDIL